MIHARAGSEDRNRLGPEGGLAIAVTAIRVRISYEVERLGAVGERGGVARAIDHGMLGSATAGPRRGSGT